MAVVVSTALPLLKLSAALAKAAGVSFSLSAGIIGVLAVAGNKSHKKAKLCRQDSCEETSEGEEAEDESSASDSETSTSVGESEVCDSPVGSCSATAITSPAPEQAVMQPKKPKVHSSWAKLRRAFLATSLKTQQQQEKLLGPQTTLTATGLVSDRWNRQKAIKEPQDASAAVLRYRKFVKGLKSSFTFSSLSAKSRRQLLADSKKDMLRTQSSIQSRSIALTASSGGAVRPAQGSIAAFHMPSKPVKQITPRRKQGPWISNLSPRDV